MYIQFAYIFGSNYVYSFNTAALRFSHTFLDLPGQMRPMMQRYDGQMLSA